MTTVSAEVLIISGLLLAVGIIWVLGWELIDLFGPDLFGSRSAKAVASFLCGLVLCGFVVMVPARLAPTEAAFRFVIQWSVPILVIAMAPMVIISRLRRGDPFQLSSFPSVRTLGPWLSPLVLAVVNIVVVLHGPAAHPTIELSAARMADAIEIDVKFAGSDGSRYVLTAAAPDLALPIKYEFMAPTDGTLTFDLPSKADLTITLTEPQGQVLRSLNMP